MNKVFNYLIKSILAGIMIGIGGTVFLSLENKVLGAIFFSIGLFMILTNGMSLYTGKVGYILENDLKYLIEVFVTLFGNFIGTFFTGYLLKYTRIYPVICAKAQSMCTIKLDDSPVSIWILSIFCGLLMYLAVNGYRVSKDTLGKYTSVFLAVTVFILCGFEHSIANMFYFSVAGMWSVKTLDYTLVMVLGNAIGGILIPLFEKQKLYLGDGKSSV
ncbi:MAG: formate/nitrite transporter family protein [Clostridia bacterium]|nr:formate/nitrite transporter family protein [Clostridia bacterium]